MRIPRPVSPFLAKRIYLGRHLCLLSRFFVSIKMPLNMRQRPRQRDYSSPWMYGSTSNFAVEMLCHPPPPATTATTMALFPLSSRPSAYCCHQMGFPPPASHHHQQQQPMNLFPQQAGFYNPPPPPLPHPDDYHDQRFQPSANKAAPASAQLTIFYGGQVVVFDDFPTDKAQEVMMVAASKGSFKSLNAAAVDSSSTIVNNTSIDSTPAVEATPTTSEFFMGFANSMIQEQIQVQAAPKTITCDPPIARRASLQRFFEKRKDRITTRAPYQQTNGSSSSSQSHGASTPESKLRTTESSNTSWLALVSQSSHQH